jgi:hypothetical protein
MAVAFDAQGTTFTDGSISPISAATIMTVGSGTNRALVVQIVTNLSTISGVTVTWDFGGTGQVCTLIGAANSSNSTARALLYGLVAPTPGLKQLRVSWTGTANVVVDAVAYTGVDPTGGTTSFAHFNSAVGTSASASVTVTSATGNAVVACGGNSDFGGTNTGNNTVVFTDNNIASGGHASGWGNRAAGAATVAMTTTVSSATDPWVQIGCDIVAAPSSFAVSSDATCGCEMNGTTNQDNIGPDEPSLTVKSGSERRRTIW